MVRTPASSSLVEAAEVDRQAIGRELGDLIRGSASTPTACPALCSLASQGEPNCSKTARVRTEGAGRTRRSPARRRFQHERLAKQVLISRRLWPPSLPSRRRSSPTCPPRNRPPSSRCKAIVIGRCFGLDFRGVHGLPRPARRPDRQRVDSDRGAGDLGAQAARRLDDSRKQHRPDDRVGRRVGGRRRGVHDSGADLPDAVRPELLQLLPDHDAGASPAASSAC